MNVKRAVTPGTVPGAVTLHSLCGLYYANACYKGKRQRTKKKFFCKLL